MPSDGPAVPENDQSRLLRGRREWQRELARAQRQQSRELVAMNRQLKQAAREALARAQALVAARLSTSPKES
jgi:hypothetical protein